jgi:hypothetical protein
MKEILSIDELHQIVQSLFIFKSFDQLDDKRMIQLDKNLLFANHIVVDFAVLDP